MKKILVSVTAVFVLLLSAGQAFAFVYSPSEDFQAAQGNVMMQTNTEQIQKMQAYMQKLQQGSLPATEQMDMYKQMQAPMMVSTFYSPIGGSRNMAFKAMSGSNFSGSRQAVWFGLMFVFTVALVWAALLLTIAFLWKLLKKHKHS